jgi:hypothetical protein
MLWYLLGAAVALLLTRWVFYALRPRARSAPMVSSGLRTVVQMYGPDYQENPDDPLSHGKGLCADIARGLASKGLGAGEASAAAYGYQVDVKVENRAFVVSVGERGGHEGAPEWLIFVNLATAPGKRDAAPAPDAPETRTLLTTLHEVLSALSGVQKIDWHDDARWLRGDEDAGTPAPF